MSTKENKTKQRRVWEEIVNKGDLSRVDEFIASSYIYHGPMGMEYKGPAGLRQLITMFRTAFPDLHTTVDDILAEGDRVATRITAQGTHKGELMGIAPTGKKVTFTGILITRWVGGKEVEAWEIPDMMGMMQQIGVIPKM